MKDQQLTAGAAVHLADEAPVDQPINGLSMDAGWHRHWFTATGEATQQQVKVIAVDNIQHRHGSAGLLFDGQPEALWINEGGGLLEVLVAWSSATQDQAAVLLTEVRVRAWSN